jgi:hypothetical protein
LLPLIAIAAQLRVHRQLGFSLVNFFSYFTNLSNLFAGVLLLSLGLLVRAAPGRTVQTLRAAAAVSMAIVGIVFSALLRNADLGSLLPWVNIVLHYVMPCVVVLDWLLVPPAVRLGRREVLLSLIYPLVYVFYVLVRGGRTGWYPYPFLNASLAGGVGSVVAYVLGITLAFVAAGWALVAAGNRLSGIRA